MTGRLLHYEWIGYSSFSSSKSASGDNRNALHFNSHNSANAITLFFHQNSIAADSPNKQETVKYIKDQIHDNPTRVNFNKIKFTNEMCTVTFSRPWGQADDGWFMRVDLPKISIVHKGYTSYDKYEVETQFQCITGKCVMINLSDPNAPSVYISGFSPIDTKTSGKVLAGKLTRAFEHLRSLCTGKKELF